MEKMPEKKAFKVEGDMIQLDGDADKPYAYVSRDELDDFSFLLKLNMEILKENAILRERINEQAIFLNSVRESSLKVKENLMQQLKWQDEMLEELDKMAEWIC